MIKRVGQVLVLSGLLILGGVVNVKATSFDYSETAEWETGVFNGVTGESSAGEIKLRSAGEWEQRAWQTPELPLTTGTAIESDGEYVYVLAGYDTWFARYHQATNRWEVLASAPYSAGYGSDMVYLDGYLYAMFGGYQKEYARYDITNNTWTELADTPDLVYRGGSLATNGTDIYALHGNSTTDFWKYTTSTGEWSMLTGTPATINYGASLVYNDGYFYTLRGVSTNTMYRYSVAAGTWSTMTNMTAVIAEDSHAAIRGAYIYITLNGNTTTMYRYDIAGNSWSTMAVLPQASRYVGSVYNAIDDMIYVFRGNGTYEFWKYDPDTDGYLGPVDMTLAPGSGSDLVYYGGYIYQPRGANTTTFYRYNLTSKTWESRAVAPAAFNDDTTGVVAGSYLYFFQGSNTTNFYRYDPAADSWATMAVAPANVNYGGSLAYPGSGDYLYATVGGYTLKHYRYSISGNSWEDTPTDLPNNSEASYGARLFSDGTNLYYVSGSRTGFLLKYTISTDTWSEVASLPYAPYWGSDAVYWDGNIYIQAGYYKGQFWRYNISSGEWLYLDSLNEYYGYHQGAYNGGALVVDTINAILYSAVGASILNMASYSIDANDYLASGTWISPVEDLTYVTAWTSLVETATKPGDSSISYETRTSADKVTWGEWTAVAGTTIGSSVNRYIQVRATLTASTDRTETPTLTALTINYQGDVTAPTAPTTFTGKSSEVGGSTLVSGSSYRYNYPYFSWSGASDAETSVAGYYVYFGTNASADPITAGNYQTTSDYVVTSNLTTGTYYLRVVAKDSAGNTSSVASGFTYGYQGVVATSVAYTSSGDFAGSTVDNMTITGDEIKLAGKAGFWREEAPGLIPAAPYYGSSTAYVSTSSKLYTLRGYNTANFYSYDIASSTWSTLADTPAVVHYGGKIVEGPGGYLYAFAGNQTSTFWRYDIAQNTWDDAAATDSPLTIYYDSALVYDGTQYIYALRGTSDDAFMRYNTTNDSWESMANVDFGATTEQISNLINYGAALTYDGADTIYALQGTQYTGLAAYSISTNTWTQLAKTPHNVYQGGHLQYDTTSNALYMIPGGGKPYLYKYAIASDTWSQLDEAPWTLGLGSSMRNAGGKLYAVRGMATTSMAIYDIAKAEWLVPERGFFREMFFGSDLATQGYGADIIKGDGSNYYLTRGNQDSTFVKYDPTTGIATELADVPGGMYLGGALVYDSTAEKIYASTSNINNNFYVYDIATNVWSREADDLLPVDPGAGSSLAYDGSRYIYYARGAGTTSFYRFDTQGSAGNKWSTLTNITATVSYGAQLVYKDGYLYIMRGSAVNPNPLYRYDVAGGSWSTLTALSDSVYNDGFLVDSGGDYLYACKGYNTASCYRYSVSGDSWSAIANFPGAIYYGGAAASDGSGKMYVLPGPGTNSYANGLYTYVMESSTTSFEEAGSYQSATIDLGEVYRLANLTLTYSSATNNTLTVSTRTSTDGVVWDAWVSANEEKAVGTSYEYKINSTVQRYLQVQFELASSDGIYSGVIADYSIKYYSDTTPPTNASELSAYTTATASASMVTNTWYNHTSPYFDWPDAEVTGGASDTETGSAIVGYYVYFGSDSDADPETAGTLITPSAFTASSLVTGSTYYLRIKSKDDAGNVSGTAWQPFIYKYDNEAPNVPTGLAADPSGYTAVNDFDFSWESATDSASGGIEYCYKTATASGTLASDQCTSGVSVTGITGYQTGTNTFYVRSRDTAGNYSSYTTGSFYYNNGAPSAPTSLTVTPETNTVNSFEFEWEAPVAYYGSLVNLQYYYSVNALPTESSVTRAYSNSLGASAYATLPGENTLYVVVMDEAGNVDYDNYASVTFTANTTAPGIPLNADIADVSVKASSAWKLALTWESPSSVGAGVASYQVYRSTDGVTYTQRASTSGISYVDTGLSQITYYYKIRACDSANNCGAFSSAVSLYPDGKYTTAAPLVGEPEVGEITTKKAEVDWTTSRTADSKVAYGTASGDYFDEEVGNSDQVTVHSLTLNNLSPGATYYFVAKWTDEDGNLGSSEEYTFATDPAPTAKEVKAVSIGLDTVNIQFTSKDASKAKVYYGTTTAFGGYSEMGVGTAESTYTVQLTGLADGTKYYYKVSLFDSENNEYEGDTYSFETLPRPRIDLVKLQQVKGTATGTILVTWVTNTPISSIITYYPSANPSAAQDNIDVKLVTAHRALISGLLPNTAYTMVVKGRDKVGNEAVASAQTFSTASDTRPPSIANLKVEPVILGVGEEATAQLVVSWDTDELSTSQVAYGEGSGGSLGSKTQQDSNRTFNHLVVISNLQPSKVYHLKALSMDEASNEATSVDRVVITPKETKSALNLVVSNLSQAFGFLGGIAGN